MIGKWLSFEYPEVYQKQIPFIFVGVVLVARARHRALGQMLEPSSSPHAKHLYTLGGRARPAI